MDHNSRYGKERINRAILISEKQAQAILDMRLQRLTGLEREKIEDEYPSTNDSNQRNIRQFLLMKKSYLLSFVKNLIEIKDRFNDESRTEIIMGGFEILRMKT